MAFFFNDLKLLGNLHFVFPFIQSLFYYQEKFSWAEIIFPIQLVDHPKHSHSHWFAAPLFSEQLISLFFIWLHNFHEWQIESPDEQLSAGFSRF